MAEAIDKLAKAPTSSKVAALVLLMGLIGAAWYFIYYGEVEAAIIAEQQKTPQLNKTLAEEQEIEKNLVKYQREIERLRKVRDEMRDRLPESAEVAELLLQIHSQAKIVGLEILRFEREEIEPETMYARIPVKMVLRGTFHQVATFFFYLGKLTRIVNVEDIEFAALDRKEAASDRIQAVCTAITFMYLPPSAAPPPEDKKGAKKAKKKPKKKEEG